MLLRSRIGLALLFALGALSPAAAGEEPPTLAARIAGLERHEGLLPFYWDAKKGQLLLEVGRPGEELLYGVGIANGAGVLEASLDRGQLGGLGLVRFDRVGPRVLLTQLQTRHRSGVADAEQTRVVSESFPTSVLASLPVVAEEKERVLVDATSFLLRDAVVLAILRDERQGDWRQDLERSAIRLERSGAFPLNTELEAVLTFSSDNPTPGLRAVLPDGGSLSVVVHHTFLKLPEPGFEIREQDPRVGVIPMRILDHTAPYSDPIERYLAMRWRLQVNRPIVFHLDRGIPEPERTAVREAALWWNHAFEAAGFKDALVIRDLPEGATFLDARYSGIEWINRAERAWSIGDFAADPRTGEILHSVARIDSHRRRTTSRMWQNLRPPRSACAVGDGPDAAWLAAPAGPAAAAAEEEALVLARLRYLSAHEVGHTLGFAHNWAATTFGWGSVLDYLGPHIEVKAGALDLSDAYPSDIGSYDHLMVRWGYSEKVDPAALEATIREASAKGIVYPMDGDPRWAEYDWGPDPVAWLGTTLAVRHVILERFGPEQLAPGRPVAELHERFNLAYLYHRFGVQAAQQYVGGQYQTNAVAGDGQTPTAWVPPAKQREALDSLLAALAPAELEVPDRIAASLVPAPNDRAPSRERFVSEAGAVWSPLTAARVLAGLIVHPLLTPEKAARLSLLTGPDALTLQELLRRLVNATWSAAPEKTARLAPLRRVSERVVLDAMLDLAASPEATPEARAALFASLGRLRTALAARHAADAAGEAHLRLAERELSEFLDKPETRKPRPARPPAPPGRPIGS